MIVISIVRQMRGIATLTKLTLRVDSRLISRAKAHAQLTGKSVSQLVADYFAIIDTPISNEANELPPITRELYGALTDTAVGEADYYAYIETRPGALPQAIDIPALQANRRFEDCTLNIFIKIWVQ